MNRLSRKPFVLHATLALAAVLSAAAQASSDPVSQAPPTPASTTTAQITYERSWPQQKVPYFRIAVRSDGTGTYSTNAIPGATAAADTPTTAQPEQPIHISARNRDKVFATAPVIRSGRCDNPNSHTANTGEKIMTLDTPGASTPARCTFNFSDDHRIADAVSTLNAMAVTLEEGTRLNYLARFDHLGLDAALGSLLDDVQAGRALDIENLTPILHRLQTDDTYMARVHDRATQLLALSEK